ncbi:DNA polymerase III subunit epsilon [Mumia zhuanghuii]|uniref:Exonuclease domain-containing protein n=2 Tax=Mumia TaxID=1546255 RepID=A0ABW1QS61_9ACTN|nr:MULTISPECIES: exonuclease domain-containing protein [Mumia]KAA1422955.1 DNA polymerase III subunit epsilon [Mumia zhuanghuii]
MYAVLDTETTGLTPAFHHRVAEVAVVLVDAEGRVEGEWSSLINPERDLGPQRIHGIRAVDAVRAPRFGEVAGHLVELFRGRTLVAHNLPFDLTFLTAEFDRLGLTFPVTHDLGLCTMTLSTDLLPGSGRSLGECCAAAGVTLDGWHAAAADTRATAGLLAHYLRVVGTPVPWQDVIDRSHALAWPGVAARSFRTAPRPDDAAVPPPSGFMAGLVDHLPRDSASELADPYLAVLDQALAEQALEPDDSGALAALSRSLGFGAADVARMHRDYLRALVRLAARDRPLSDAERRDLERVTAALGLDGSDLEAAMAGAAVPVDVPPFALPRSARIVFTGEMPEPHDVWARRAVEHGLTVLDAVTPEVDVVVAADEYTMSIKARKARGRGIPVITVEEFARHLAERGGTEYEPASRPAHGF